MTYEHSQGMRVSGYVQCKEFPCQDVRHENYIGSRVYPSYLQAGASFFIEKSKCKMIAENIAHALAFANAPE